MKPTQIIQNAVMTPDGQVLISERASDLKFYLDDRGNECSIWGGSTIFQYSGRSPYPGHGCEDLSLTTGSLEDEIMERLLWGSLGRDGWKERPLPPYQWQPIKNMSTGHLINCMAGGWVRSGSLHYAVMARHLLARILDPAFQVFMVTSDLPFIDLCYDLDLASETAKKHRDQGSTVSVVVPARIQP